MSRIRSVQDYLCEIEEYLKKTLQDEKLSTAAQIKRRYLLDRFYALELQANDDKNPLGSIVTHARSVVLPQPTTITTTSSSSLTTTLSSSTQGEHLNKEHLLGTTSENKHEVEESLYNLYEEPVIYSSLHGDDYDDGVIPPASFAQAEDCSDTEYESFEEEENAKADSRHDNDRQTRDVPLPQAKKIVGNELNLLSRLPNVHHSGHLFHKGLLAWFKRFCIISDSRLLTFKSRKHLRPLLILDLIGCDVESVVRETSKYKHAIKISRPTSGDVQSNLITHSSVSTNNNSSSSIGAGNDANVCWFYARDKETIHHWMLHLCLSGCLKSSNEKTVENATDNIAADTDSGGCTSTCDNQASISGGSSEGGSGDGMSSAGSTGLERKPSNGSSVSVGLKKKLKIGESLQSLIWSSFSKSRKYDKDDKIKRTFIEAGGHDAEISHLAGYVNINVENDPMEGQGRWTKKFCVARQGRMDCYRDPLVENVESTVPLKNSIIVDVDKQNKRISMSCCEATSAGTERMVLVNLEFFNATDFNKWFILVYKETEKDSMSEGVYNEVYDWKVYSTTSDLQPPPLPKERPQSKLVSACVQSDCDVQLHNNNNNINNDNNSNNVYESQCARGLSSIAEDSFLAGDFMHKDDSFHLQEIMASAFDDIKRNLNEGLKHPAISLPGFKPPTSKSLAVVAADLPNRSSSLTAIHTSFSPSIFSSPLRDSNRSRREFGNSKCHSLSLASSAILLSSSSAALPSSSLSALPPPSSAPSSIVLSPPRPSPPLKFRVEAASKATLEPTSPSKSHVNNKTSNHRSSSVPRSSIASEINKSNAPSVLSYSQVNPRPASQVSSNRNSLVQSNFDFSLIKNELNKRHSVVNYNLNSIAITTTTPSPGHVAVKSTIGSTNNKNNINISRNNNLYSKPEKVAGSFISGRDYKVQQSKVTSSPSATTTTLPVATSSNSSTAPSSSSRTTGPTSRSSNPSAISLSSCQSASLVSKAMTNKQSTNATSRVSSTIATTKLSSKTTSPILSATAFNKMKTSNGSGNEVVNSDPISKRASLVALSALSTSNSKLREARAEIRKSSLELMSSTKLEKTFSAPITTTPGNTYIPS